MTDVLGALGYLAAWPASTFAIANELGLIRSLSGLSSRGGDGWRARPRHLRDLVTPDCWPALQAVLGSVSTAADPGSVAIPWSALQGEGCVSRLPAAATQPAPEPLYLVSLRGPEPTPPGSDPADPRPGAPVAPRPRSLSLATLEAHNQALRLANEEQAALNEELLASLHELQMRGTEAQNLQKNLQLRNKELSRTAAELQGLLDATDIPMLILDVAGRILAFTSAITSLYPLRPADRGRELEDIAGLVHFPDLTGRIRAALDSGEDSRGEFATLDGTEVFDVKLRPYRDSRGVGIGAILTFINVTESKTHKRELVFLAEHDPLTGLLNRRVLLDALGRLEQAPAPRDGKAAVLYIDLDHFKAVNDRYGHAVGDELLKRAASRIRRCAGGADIVVRLGGDEFAILMPEVSGTEACSSLASRIILALGQPFDLGNCVVTVGGSIGLAVERPPDISPSMLVECADIALSHSKRTGREKWSQFDRSMSFLGSERITLASRIRSALGDGEFHLLYQPIVCLDSGGILKYEALLRWRQPDGAMVMPDQFIELAEECGAIGDITDWVIRSACHAAAAWPAGLRVTVNVSPADIEGERLLQTVQSALESSGMAASRLEIEITERGHLEAGSRTLGNLHSLRRLGVSLCLDDFGIGTSTLANLQKLPIDCLKIDRSFTSNLASDPRQAVFVKAVIALGKGLGIGVCAEGVETATQADLLRSWGVCEAQGWHFGRPRTAIV